ncbi:MAG: TolC family protein [Planctomycetaceae bacterium]|nr:TolC family protein [Planctomycetaceae bacterium]
MNCLRRFTAVIAGACFASICLVGCHPQQPLYLTEKGQYQKKFISKATRIDYPDTEVSSTPEVCNSLPPLTLDNPNPANFWDLTLEEAVQMALKNSKVIRTLNGVSFSQAGTNGTPGQLLSSPASVGTVYDPALIESDPRYGVEAALSAFDGQLAAGVNWAKSDVADGGSINSPYSGANFAGNGDRGTFSVGINKTMSTGGRAYVNQGNAYSAPYSAWTTYLEGGFTQPLLQGNGIQFNRIAGPDSGTPGYYNGVAIARISTDTALNDFEMAARNLVADVEKAYWNLYYAYHYLESVKSGRDSAHQTWAQTHTMYTLGAAGGRAQYEAQARNNYFTFRAQTEVAQSNLFKTENTLRYIIGLTSTDGRLIRPVDDPIIAPLKLDWQNIMCESLIRSPELRKQKWDVKKRELELIASKNFLLPRLDFNAGYVWNGAGRDLLNSDNSRSNAFGSMTNGDYASWIMGLNASMPFGWRKELAGVRNAQLNLARSRALLQEQELELTHQLADSFREISLAYQQSRTMLQRRIAADDEVSSVSAAYRVGTTTLDQLLDAQKRQAEAETAYYRSIVDYNLAITTLHYRKGSLLEYNNVALAEGMWPAKAYFDAKRRARERDAGHYLNYGFTRPRVVSRGAYQQFQDNGSITDGSIFSDGESTPVQVPQGEPVIAPPAPATFETPQASIDTVVVEEKISPVSFTTPAVATPVPNRNNRYVR